MRRHDPDARELSPASVLAGLVAALAAGPWPDLGPTSFLWRVPLTVAASVVAVRRGSRAIWAALVLAAAGLVLDLVVPGRVDPRDVARRVTAQVARVQVKLGNLADRQAVRQHLVTTGAEAEPEEPFRLLASLGEDLGVVPSALVLVDERGQPLAWQGGGRRLPLRLRPLGDRTVTAEPAVGSLWLWWREPVFDSGRPVGALLLGEEVPERGVRALLGVSGGRAALVVPRLTGGEPVKAPSGERMLGLAVRSTAPRWWSSRGLAAVAAALVLAATGQGWLRVGLLAAAAVTALAGGGAWNRWWLPAALLALAFGARRLSAGMATRLSAAVLLAAATWATAGLLEEIGLDPTPGNLLLPTPAQWALILAGTLLLRGVPAGRRPAPWWLVVAGVAPLLVGVNLADARLLGVGLGVAVLVALPGRTVALPALAAAAVLVGSEDAGRQRALVATTESTLARLEQAEAPARALLASLPGPALAEVVKLPAAERLVVLGRLAQWVDANAVLPGVSLVLLDPSGQPAATWGETAVPGEAAGRDIAARVLDEGWKLVARAAPEPRDVLAALAAAGLDGPLAVYDRSGAPVARGATFRPLSPARIGQALAAGKTWDRVSVGEREFATYLRACGDRVLAVPWVRRSRAETALVMVALALWGALPVAAWEQRARIRGWWRRRRTFTARMEALLVASSLLPVVLLGQFLPQQWTRERQRARLELGRAVGRPIVAAGPQRALSWLVRDMGATVAVYQGGTMVSCTRPDLAALGTVPWLPPPEAYVRAVRGWREPLVTARAETDVYVPVSEGQQPLVVGVLDLQVAGLAGGPTPGEWFGIASLLASVVALAAAERLGRRLTGPLGRLVDGVRRLESGEPLGAVVAGGDEDVEALGRAIATMAETVRRREEELRRGRDLLERVLATLSAAVVVVGENDRFALANRAARALLGDGDEAGALASRFDPAVVAMVARARGGEGSDATVQPSSRPGAVWRASVQGLEGSPGGVLVVLEDLSEVARAERLASLAEAARIVAHEVKNPLTPIRLWAEELAAALDRGPDAVVSVARQAAEQILERVQHLREVAQGFSNLVGLEHWHAEPVALAPVAREVVGEYEVLAQRGVRLALDVDAEAAVVADPTWVRRALRNLLENSARALAGRRGSIRLSLARTEREAVLSVHDDGGGVPEGSLARLFEPHFSTTTEGSGLGLALVQRVVARAGGRVEASNVDGGLLVKLIFPAA